MYSEILSGLKNLFDLVSGVDERSIQRKKAYTEVLFAVSDALNETSIYYFNRPVKRDLIKEAQLVKLWSKASILVRDHNDELAILFEHKARYWINSTINPVKEDLLSLEAIRDKYIELLKK